MAAVIGQKMTSLAPPVNHMDQVSPDTSDSECSDSHQSTVRPTNTDIGKRVAYYSSTDKKQKYGVLRFIGDTEFASGTWCGVELNNASGKNNGTFKGIRYFNCDQNHGVFVPLNKVELDFGRRARSRPNSSPSSRSASVDRDVPHTKAGSQALSASVPAQKGLNTLSLQQQLVNRLSTPVTKRKTSLQPTTTSRRQPLKAFATKGVNREEPKETKKLTPFKYGGMVKAQSTENLSKSGGNLTPKMPSKKSSSERDLRGVGGKGSAPSSKKESKFSRKNRVSSCSDLLAESKPSKARTPNVKPTPPVPRTSTPDTSSIKPTVPIPRTSTPGTRNESAPDGCSSPDDDSGSNTSQADEHSAAVSTPTAGDVAFILTPEVGIVKEPTVHPNTPTTKDMAFQEGLEAKTGVNKKIANTDGLESAPVLLIKNERVAPSYNQSSVASPESVVNKCYKNRPSGTATLAHPLTQHTAPPHTQPTEDLPDGNYSLASLLDPSNTLEGVSLANVLAALREQNRLNDQQQKSHKIQLENLHKEYSDKLAKMERQHKAALKELVERHQSEIMALNRAHVEELKRYR